jgi:hypothetical protein
MLHIARVTCLGHRDQPSTAVQLPSKSDIVYQGIPFNAIFSLSAERFSALRPNVIAIFYREMSTLLTPHILEIRTSDIRKSTLARFWHLFPCQAAGIYPYYVSRRG